MSIDTDRRVYRGSSLEELLPRIKAELGEDAVVVRQREGVVGGFGGFFGKHCVEVEVMRPPAPARFSIPSRDVAARYELQDDTFESEPESDIVQTLLDQAAPFGSQLDIATRQLAEEESKYEPPEWAETERAQPDSSPHRFVRPDSGASRTRPMRSARR